jgi:phenylalanyl-tRNA synthetase beta chain
MLCSARELKLSDEHGGLLILSSDAAVGRSIREHLNLDDTLFTLKLTPNLAHCLSVYGVAREVSALTGAPLLQPEFPKATTVHTDKVPVRVEAPDLCGRFSGRIIRNVNTKAATPAWMVDRLARCGQRSVTALVDISNYVMFEYGRPSHIFDLDKIHGGLVVRWGREGEALKLLNGNTIEVDANVGVIADDQAVESLAGIMGGDATAVSDDTSAAPSTKVAPQAVMHHSAAVVQKSMAAAIQKTPGSASCLVRDCGGVSSGRRRLRNHTSAGTMSETSSAIRQPACSAAISDSTPISAT